MAVTWYAGFELQQRWDVVECSETLLRNRAGTYWHAAKRFLKIGPGRIGCMRNASSMSDLGPKGICGTLLLCRIYKEGWAQRICAKGLSYVEFVRLRGERVLPLSCREWTAVTQAGRAGVRG